MWVSLCHFHCLFGSGPGTGDISRESRRVKLDPIWTERGDRVQASERLAVAVPAGRGVGLGIGSGVPLSQVATTPDLPARRTYFDRGPDGQQRRTNAARPRRRP